MNIVKLVENGCRYSEDEIVSHPIDRAQRHAAQRCFGSPSTKHNSIRRELMTPAEQLRALQEHHQQHHQQHQRLPLAVRSIISSTGAGFVYGTLFGSVVAGFEGLRASPAHERVRGMVHHMRHHVPQTAGRIAMVTCLFRVASLTLTSLRGDGSEEDLWDVLLAAPIAGAVLKMRHGPRAAMQSAVAFGSIGAVMIIFHSVETRVAHSSHGQQHRHQKSDVLEEIAFAEELE